MVATIVGPWPLRLITARLCPPNHRSPALLLEQVCLLLTKQLCWACNTIPKMFILAAFPAARAKHTGKLLCLQVASTSSDQRETDTIAEWARDLSTIGKSWAPLEDRDRAARGLHLQLISLLNTPDTGPFHSLLHLGCVPLLLSVLQEGMKEPHEDRCRLAALQTQVCQLCGILALDPGLREVLALEGAGPLLLNHFTILPDTPDAVALHLAAYTALQGLLTAEVSVVQRSHGAF